MAHKAFKRAVNLDPIWFTLPDRDDNDVRFDCADDMPAGVVLAFASGVTGDEAEKTSKGALDSVHELFDTAIVEDQHEQFWALINDKKGKVGIAMLIEVASWLTEEYTARPTGPSSGDGQPAKPSGPGSTGGALHAVTTYSKPEQPALTPS
jgi:hypothetical protein